MASYDREVEERVLAAMLCHRWALDAGSDVETLDFFLLHNRAVFDAMRNAECRQDPRVATVEVVDAVVEEFERTDRETGTNYIEIFGGYRRIAESWFVAFFERAGRNYDFVSEFEADAKWLRSLVRVRESQVEREASA